MSKYLVKEASIHKVSELPNIWKEITMIASTGILFCPTLCIIIEKDYIAINSSYELSVLLPSTFIPKFRSQMHLKIWSKKDKYL